MPDNNVEQLKREIQELKDMLKDREAALPAHSVTPHQIMIIEELEEKIADKEKSLREFLSSHHHAGQPQ
ncbi:MAG: histidine kinase [Deltaproteobacteria bacterium]|nr:histidine kinase [Deltaproteobacteria bacterium]